MKKLALLLSLLALGALGLVACGGSDDDQATAASETETTGDRTTRHELAADNKSCGAFLRDHVPPFRLAVVEGDISCGVARRVMHDWARDRLPGSWRCAGPEAGVVCTKKPGTSSRAGVSSRLAITARLASEALTEADPGKNARLSNEERIEQNGNEWAALFAEGGFKPGLWRYMGQPAGERLGCERVGHRPIKNCTPPSAKYRESFADATVERVVIEGHHATAEFSNGESVEFDGQKADEGDKAVEHSAWLIPETWFKKIARRNFEP
jgi:hypothetical protein